MEKLTNEKRKEHPYYSKDTKFLQWAKKDDKKKEIKVKQEELLDWINKIDPNQYSELPEEEKKLKQKEQNQELSKRRAEIQALQEQLKELQANKTGSKAFEVSYTPPNRRMKKQAIKNRNK